MSRRSVVYWKSGSVNQGSDFLPHGLLLPLSVQCLPSDYIEIPNNVDYVAVVGADLPGYTEGYLYSVEEFRSSALSPASGWVVGFEADQLIPSSLKLPISLVVRPQQPFEDALPPPAWVLSLGSIARPPPLTVQPISSRLPTVHEDRIPQMISEYVITGDGEIEEVVLGPWGSQRTAILIGGQIVLGLSPTGAERIYRFQSTLETDFLSFAVESSSIVFADGETIRVRQLSDSSERQLADGGRRGMFAQHGRDLVFFEASGGWAYRVDEEQISAPAYNVGSVHAMQVKAGIFSSLIIAGDDWSREWGTPSLREEPPYTYEVGVRKPFGWLDVELVFSPDGQSLRRAEFSDGPSLVFELSDLGLQGSIIDVLRCGSVLLFLTDAGVLGRVVDDNFASIVYEFDSVPLRLFSDGRDVGVLTRGEPDSVGASNLVVHFFDCAMNY